MSVIGQKIHLGMKIPHLHQETIEEVKQRADIVDVVSEHVVLKKRGKDFIGLCPFHDEKSPSFTVSATKQMYYCFGCGAGGNAIKFLMEIGKHSFSEVVLDLARRYQVPVKTLEPEQRQELQRQLSIREQLYEILAIACNFYQHALRQPQGDHAREYLQTKRQLKEETIQQFQLGYAPTGWETLYGYLVQQKRYPIELVEQVGLIKPRKTSGGYYDQFRDRLMIPIHDIQGRVIGFGARTLTGEEPKYLNSPETQLFEKGKTLFALDKAKAAIAKQDQAVVVEGYFDAIALHAAGITNVVASLGTALTQSQVRLILRYTESKQIVLNFDADTAGTTATARAISEIADLAYKGEVQLRILNIPDGKDADEFLNTTGSPEVYHQLLATAPLWLDWQIQQLLIGKNLKQADQYQQVTRNMIKLLSQLNNHDSRTHYVNHCAEILSQENSSLVPQLAKYLLKEIHRPKRRSTSTEKHSETKSLPIPSEHSLLEKAESLLLRIYLHCPEYRPDVIKALEERDLDFSLSHHRFLWGQILATEPRNNTITISPSTEGSTALISQLQDRCIQFPDQFAQISPLFHLDEYTERDLLRAPEMIQYAAACIERVLCEKRSRHFLKLWQQTDRVTEPDRWQRYCQEFLAIKQRIKELDHELRFLYFYR